MLILASLSADIVTDWLLLLLLQAEVAACKELIGMKQDMLEPTLTSGMTDE